MADVDPEFARLRDDVMLEPTTMQWESGPSCSAIPMEPR